MASPAVEGVPALLHGPDPPVATWSATMPTNRVVGEFVVIHLLVRGTTATASPPPGWSALGNSPTGTSTQFFFYRQMDGLEDTSVTGNLSEAAYVSAFAWRVSGIDPADVVSGVPAGFAPATASTTSTYNDFATDTRDTLVQSGGGNPGPQSVSDWTNGETELYDAAISGTGIARTLYGAFKPQGAAGAVGVTTATISASVISSTLHYALGSNVAPPAPPTGLAAAWATV